MAAGKLAACLALLVLGWVVSAQPGPPERRELIYCADLMSHGEREDYRSRMRAAATWEERQALRAAHRTEMQERARQAGRSGECDGAGRRWRGGRGQ